MKKQIATTNAPAAIGPYSQGVECGNLVFVSGQIPVNPATGEIVKGDIKAQTAQVFENIKAVLAQAGCALSDIVKTTVFITDIADFGAMNEVYATYIKDCVLPARSAFQVVNLPKGANVEIEVIACKCAQ